MPFEPSVSYSEFLIKKSVHRIKEKNSDWILNNFLARSTIFHQFCSGYFPNLFERIIWHRGVYVRTEEISYLPVYKGPLINRFCHQVVLVDGKAGEGVKENY